MILQLYRLRVSLILFLILCFQESYPQKLSYKELYKMGIEAYNLQNYKEAFKCFSEAQFCSERPKNNDLKDWLFKTNKLVAQSVYKEQWRSRYYYVSPFKEGRAYVFKDGKYAFVNEKGELLTPLDYDFVTCYNKGLAKVFVNQKAGIIDLNGKAIVPCIYDDIEGVNASLYIVKQGEMDFLYNAEENKIISDGYGHICSLNNRLFKASIYEDWISKVWIIDIDGNKTDTSYFNIIHSFINGYALAEVKSKRTVLDSLGKPLLPFTDMELINLGDGFFKSGKEFFILRNKKLVKIKADTFERLSNGFFLITRNNLKGVVNKLGQEVIPPKYAFISMQPNNIFIVAVSQKYGVYNSEGDLICKLQYDKIDDYAEGLALVRNSGSFGFIDTLGKLKIPVQYSKALSFSEGLAMVGKNGVYGYINTNNEFVIPLKYSKADSFKDGVAIVREGRKEITINKEGNEVIKESASNASTSSKKAILKEQADILEMLSKPSSRFMYDSLFNVGGYWLTYNNLLTEDIDSLRSIMSEDEFFYWTNFIALTVHNFVRFCNRELEADITKSEERGKAIMLTVNQKLIRSAYLHSKDMFEKNYFSHNGSDGKVFSTRIKAQNYNPSSVGENIAFNQSNIEEVMSGWVESTGHFLNVVYIGFEEMGIGYFNKYWTVNFGREHE